MLAVYARGETGFATLFPVRTVGSTEREALLTMKALRVGTPRATGYGAIIVGLGKSGGRRLRAATTIQARREVTKLVARHGTVLLCRAVAVGLGGRTVYEIMESVEAKRQTEAMRDSDLLLVSPTGALVQKAFNVSNSRDIDRMVSKLAGQLRTADRKFIEPYLKKYMATLDVNWPSLKPREFDRVFSSARKVMSKLAIGELMPVWSDKIRITITGVARDTRKIVHDYITPRVGLSLKAPERAAIDAQANQAGFFIRDEFGKRSDLLTAQGREIVNRGLRDGLGRDGIAKELRALPGMWEKYGFNYARTVAQNSVSRARTTAEVSGYINAGIDYLEVQAILDERTTEICRSLDGTVVECHVAWQQIEAASKITNPEDIGKVSPFMRERVDPKTGGRFIETANGHRIADVVRSGVGRVDDRGQHLFHRLGKDLSNVGVGVPPYHHGCRSWTVPMSDTVQIPTTFVARTAPIAPPPRPKAPLARPGRPRPGFAPVAQPKPTPHPFSRPVEYFRGTVVSQGVTRLVGQTDPVLMAERLGLPAALETATPAIAYRSALSSGQADAVAARFRPVDSGALVISDAGWQAMAAKRTSPDKLGEVMGKLRLGGRDLAVSMRLARLGPEQLRTIVLHESKFGASRLYTVRGLDDARTTHLRFDLAKRSKANEPLAALRKATTSAEIKAALKEVKDSGFLTQKTVAAKVAVAA